MAGASTLLDIMPPPVLVARAKRPRSSDTASAPQSSGRKRTRVGNSNIKKHEWAWVQQHVLWRNEHDMETQFFIDGIKHDYKNVHRRICRAGATQVKPVENQEDLRKLPECIKLEPPLPKFSPIQRIDAVDAEQNLESSSQTPEDALTSISSESSYASDTESDELISEDDEDGTAIVGNDFLGNLPLSEIIEDLRTALPCYRKPRDYTFLHLKKACRHDYTAGRMESLKHLADKLCLFRDRRDEGDPMSYLELILLLVREGIVSTSYFLESVIRTMKGRDLKILRWIAHNFEDLSDFAARALGTAAYQDKFEAVHVLLDEFEVDINGKVSSPHESLGCHCQISIIEYAQIPRLDGGEPGASDKTIEYLVRRGATESAGGDLGLLDLLHCVLRNRWADGEVFRSRVETVVQRMHGFAKIVGGPESVLETCMLESESDYRLGYHQFWAFNYLLDQTETLSSCSPLAALICGHARLEISEEPLQKVLAMTENINSYCHSVGLRKYFERVGMRHRPYNIIQSVNPLQAAALLGREDIIQRLLESGADINSPAQGSGGVTPLQAICSLKTRLVDRMMKLRVLELLLKGGANVNAAPAWNFGLSALQAAAFVGDVEVAELLVSRKADIDAPACKYGGGTALALAARKGHLDMVRFLLEKGAAIPAAGVEIFSFGKTYEDHKTILDLLDMSAKDLEVRYGRNGTALRDSSEYEDEWAKSLVYESKG